MSRLSDIAAKPTLQQYAQGAAQSALQPVADFIAPTVDVPVAVGYFKQYTEKNRFRIPNTRRALGGRAVELGWDAADATYNCAAHALDFPVDMVETDASMEYALQEGAGMIAEVAGLAHEKTVIDKAIASVGAGTDKNWGSGGTNPIDDVDTAVIAVLKACKYGSLMGVRLLFGALAWQQFKNNSNVTGKFIVGNPKTAGKVAIPTLEAVGELFLGVPDVRASFAVYDTAAEGVAESISFMLERAVLVFAAKSSPTRRDPSFMKTFRLAGRWMVPGTYQRDDGRVEVAKFDWSEDVQVTNSSAAVRLNGNAS